MRRMISICLALLCLILVAQARYTEENVEYAQNRFIVKLWPGAADLKPVSDGLFTRTSDAHLTALNIKWKVVQVERLFTGAPPKESSEVDLPGYWRFWVDEPVDLEAVLSDYAAAPLVEHVEPVGIHRVSYSPTDTYWPNQWYIRNTGGDHDIDTYEGWDVERGDSLAILGIVDTGVQYSHPDLRGMMWRNWTERNGTPGVDDDGNGLVDDTVGWDFVTGISGCAGGEDCSTPDADPKDYAGHGTHCAGIAAAQTNNSVGVAGIAGGGTGYVGARIMALRVGWLEPNGMGYVGMDFCASAIDYARQKGVCAINCSWGSSASGGLPAAVTAAINAGIVFCVAAGNENSSAQDYLASRGDCIDVAATDASDVKASWSNYGSWVDVSAPGVSIYSTFSDHYTNTYEYLDGTSMAAPCVTGEAGLLKSLYHSWTRVQITDAIVNHVDNIYDENPGWEGLLGSGRINVNLALLSAGIITVTKPNGGEVWVVGTTDTVRWTSLNYSGTVNIHLNRSYPSGPWETIASNTANDGVQTWPVTVPTTALARVRVVGYTNPSIGDTSDGNFSIGNPNITVLAPNGGGTWYIGTTDTIKWSSVGVSGTIKIELNRTYPTGGWETLFAGTTNDGVEPWPVTGATSTQSRIRITSVSTPSITDISDNNFIIASPFITVYDPNGGEVWTQSESQAFTWGGGGISGNVKIELNRDYPSGTWDVLYAGVPFTNYLQDWIVTGPSTITARARITSVSSPSVYDFSDANFTINSAGPLEILHDPLDDGEPGTVLVVASAIDDQPGVTMKAFHRLLGAGTWDSTTMNSTGNPNEFSATLGPLDDGSYQYYLRAKAVDNEVATTDIYDFQLYPFCGTTIAYDDGSAERYNWAGAEEFRWAVRFTPASTPFILCGARFSVSRISPDSAHSSIFVEVYSASAGLPGALLFRDTTGSIGDVVGGLPPGQTYWADAVIRGGSGEPLVLYSDFFIAVGNPDTLLYEAFSRDTTSPNSGRSFLYDGCTLQWYNENDVWGNCKPGDRMVRAIGYYQTPPQVVIYRSGNDASLYWTSTGAPYYRIYSDTTPFGSYGTSEGSASDTTFLDVGAVSSATLKFYRVLSSTLP